MVLSRVDSGELALDTKVAFGTADLLEYAPVTKSRAAEGALTVETLCAASVEASDNTAANLLLRLVGGPAGLTEYLRGLGDPATRLDRLEPDLNTNLEGDARDTTTPEAMVATMNTLLVGEALRFESRARLLDWMVGSKTGKDRLRAGLPATWRVGDKTGTCENGATNDVAIAWPPGRAPILVAAYFTGSPRSPGERNAALAEAARVVAEALAR
jgi:beta-lactamase class A